MRPLHIAALAHHMKPITRSDLSNMLLCPMPGTLVNVLVNEGDIIQPNQTLCIVEAMKMETEIQSAVSGKVERILVQEGDAVDMDQPLFLVV
mgnify:CR=1 FL=1